MRTGLSLQTSWTLINSCYLLSLREFPVSIRTDQSFSFLAVKRFSQLLNLGLWDKRNQVIAKIVKFENGMPVNDFGQIEPENFGKFSFLLKIYPFTRVLNYKIESFN